MSEITPEEDAFMRSLYRQLEDSGVGIEPWTDQELEEHLERFQERMRHMHGDPAEGTRIDQIVADATRPRSIGGEMLLAKLAEPAPEPGWSVPDPCRGESHWIESTGYPACGLRMFYGGVRSPAPVEVPCAECVPLSLRGPRALDGRTNLTSRGRNGQMTHKLGMRDKRHLVDHGVSVPEVPPMTDDEVLGALAFLYRMSRWERLEIARVGDLYGGYCVERRGGRMIHVPAALMEPERHAVIMLLKALIDQSGWQRLEMIAITGTIQAGGWCERADGTGLQVRI